MATTARSARGRTAKGKGRAFDAARLVRRGAGDGRAPRMTDAQRAIVLAGLDRARKSIEGEMTEKGVRPAPGTHALDLAVAIAGDVVVAEPRQTAPREVPTFGPDALAVALLAGLPPSARETAVRDAVRTCHVAATDAARQTTLAECTQLLASIAEDEHRARGLMELKGGGAVAGATTGKPGVVVAGTVGARAVRISVRGE